jgi:RNA polymerase sigma factor (sigma-70 family)
VEDDSDEMVWRQVLSGDSRRYGKIWDRHRDRIFRHLIASGNTASSAEDLTAATFLELWRHRGTVRFVDGSLLPWLIVTAQNVSRNAARATRRYERFLVALPPPPVVPDPADPIADRDDEHLIALRAAIAAARPADATLLAMTALEGFTTREAAAALGLSESAAKMRLSRLRARLRTAVTAQPFPEGASRW